MELKDTVDMMLSEDYKERFKAEYYQLVNRRKGLMTMLEKWENGTLDFKPVCIKDIYKAQLDAMESYIAMLEIRAYFEKKELLKCLDNAMTKIMGEIVSYVKEQNR